LWNLLGQAVPLAAAVVAIPFLVKGLGTDRFGILTLAWVIIGYLSIFDLGMGRALTKVVAEELARGSSAELPRLIWTALLLMGLLGVLATCAMVMLSPWLVERVLRIPSHLMLEAIHTFYWLAFCVPIVIITSGLRGILEASIRFDLANVVRVPTGIMTFVGPLIILPFTTSLVPIVALLVLVRLAGSVVHLLLCLRVMPSLSQKVVPHWSSVLPLLRLGGWMTVTNVVSPLMVSLDRFLISAFISIAAVAYYTTPYEVVTKLLVIPVALAGVLFPAFSASSLRDPETTTLLFERGAKSVFCFLFPLLLFLTIYAHELLALWVGGEFADRSTRVLQWLGLGVMANGLATVPFTLVQALGRPDLTGKLQIVELPLYLVGITWLVRHWGIEGAAVGWCLRVTVDGVVLFVFAGRCFPSSCATVRHMTIPILAGMLALGLAMVLPTLAVKTLFFLIGVPVFATLSWLRLLTHDDRSVVVSWLRSAVHGRWKDLIA